jgi:hypothetical protein
MHTLDNFYKSKQWQKLLEVIKLERVNSEGQLICWHCGKPIVNKYDCIGHHTIFLTEDNVNDAEISLNPELIQLVHHSCHNKIHNKLGYTKREIYLVYGCPLSGKSTYVKTVAEPGDLIIDVNRVWSCVSGLDSSVKPPVLNSVVFGIRDRLLEMVKYRVGKWNNCYIVGGYPLISERERLCKELGAREIFIDTPKEVCLERLSASEDRDRAEYTKYIEEWWRRFTPDTPPGTLLE